MQILVIGGFGYIGSQVLDSLARHEDYKDCEIVVVDNWSYGRGAPPLLAYYADRFKRFRSFCVDLSRRDCDSLKHIVANSNYIINAASLTQIPNSELHVKYIVGGVANLTDMILASDPPLNKVIDISSTSVYGAVRATMPDVSEPYGEDVFPDPGTALHDYAASKLEAERIWLSDRCRGLPFTVFRLSTAFGYAVGMRYNQFVNQFLVDAVAGRPSVLPGSPDDYRPHVHVADVAGLVLHLLEGAPQAHGQLVNVGARELNPRLGDLYASLADMLRTEFDIDPKYDFASELGRETIRESYRVDFTKFETLVGLPLEHDFISGARELVRKVRGA
jgi:nucleoside-diphosphate-sugar epimerase